jgi:oxygen-independent coproporphyrinogen-3 oxidase
VEPAREALSAEIARTGAVLRENGLTVRSFYMGGGTPTTLTARQMDRLLGQLEAHLPLEQCIEYTVEAGRPDTITREKLQVLKDHGVGRVSINPQTLEENVLRAIGRRHGADEIAPACALAREVGFDSVNMDLIAGLPQDSFEGFQRSLEGVMALDPENITVHTLALKKGSRLMENGGALPGGDEVARMLELSLDRLRGAGYLPYYLYRQKYMSGSLENVGWAKPGQESLYNIVMMEELQTVVSVGGGGVTKLVDPDAGKIIRLPNPKYPHDYLASMEKVLAQKAEITHFYAR